MRTSEHHDRIDAGQRRNENADDRRDDPDRHDRAEEQQAVGRVPADLPVALAGDQRNEPEEGEVGENEHPGGLRAGFRHQRLAGQNILGTVERKT